MMSFVNSALKRSIYKIIQTVNILKNKEEDTTFLGK